MDTSWIVTITTIIAAPIATILAARANSRAHVRTAEVSKDDTPAWESFTKGLREQMDTMQTRLDSLQGQVDDLRKELNLRDRIIGAFAAHTRAWRIRHPNRSEWPRLPDILEDYLDADGH